MAHAEYPHGRIVPYMHSGLPVIPIPPRSLTFVRYLLPNALARAEHEDLAARLIEAAHAHNSWVGVSYDGLLACIASDARTKSHEVASPFALDAIVNPSWRDTFASEVDAMVAAGYLNVRDHNQQRVIFPTQRLVERIFRAQHA